MTATARPIPFWTVEDEIDEVGGFRTLHVKGSRFIAAAADRGRFQVVDPEASVFVCELKDEKETRAWLIQAARAEDVPPSGTL